jgi:hypothetical protein
MNTVNGAALVRRTAVEAAGGFDESLRDGCEDWDFWITLLERGLKGRILHDFLYNYRRHGASMTQSMMRGDRHPRLYQQLARKHAASFREHLPALLARRERDMATLRIETHDLLLDQFMTLEPQVMKMRDDVAGLDRMASTGRAEPRVAAALEAARAEVAALRSSLSWRLTTPLRAVYDALGLGRVRKSGPAA